MAEKKAEGSHSYSTAQYILANVPTADSLTVHKAAPAHGQGATAGKDTSYTAKYSTAQCSEV